MDSLLRRVMCAHFCLRLSIHSRRWSYGFVIFDQALEHKADTASLTTPATRDVYTTLLEALKKGNITRREFRKRCEAEVSFVDDTCFGILRRRAQEEAALKTLVDDTAPTGHVAAGLANEDNVEDKDEADDSTGLHSGWFPTNFTRNPT